MQVSTITGRGTVSGAIEETWTFAKGSLAGVVYYNTYGSNLVPGQTGQNVAVSAKIFTGFATQPTAFLYTTGASVFPFGPCVSCHALSSERIDASRAANTLRIRRGLGQRPLAACRFDLTKTPKAHFPASRRSQWIRRTTGGCPRSIRTALCS